MRRASEKHGVARRCNAILLLDDGWTCEDVARALYLDDDTVRGWHKAFTTDGAAALRAFGWKGSAGKLSRRQEAELAETLSAQLFLSTAAVRAHVEQRYGIVYSKPGMIKLLHRLGFDYRKPKGLPAKADAAVQEAFVAAYETLLTRLLPDEVVYFGDAVHPEYQSRPAHGWIRRGDRLAVKKGKGRERMNLMGALNLETFDLELIETLKMSTGTTIDLMERLERHNPGRRLIHLILDRAPIHRGKAVKAWLARPGCRIRLHFLPAYAPNLNAIERLWKLMHEHVTHNRYYPNFRTFAEAIMRFFKTTLPKNWKSFREIVNDNFHIVRPEQFRIIG
ncbi:IS630 family transposase [Mesorhizobium sp. ASY16-5R]|uniref:IS630 family transposase n=1 Tax=Mesorhizobium sp. ASY16-5R TaxID=3445772 RepID=UPI003FA17F64